MEASEKLIYLIETCCIRWDDVQELCMWIERDGLDHVYDCVHYMFDEDILQHEYC